MRKLKLTALSAVLILYSISGSAQEALWQSDFEKEIEWSKITEVGILLIGTSDMILHGLDSRDGNHLWQTDIMKGASGIKGADGKKQEKRLFLSSLFRYSRTKKTLQCQTSL